MLYITLILSFLLAFFITPFVKKLAIKIGAMDKPNQRKVHQSVMPRIGGLSIYIAFLISFLTFIPKNNYTYAILLGSTVIIMTGILDDIKELSAKVKFLGQAIAAGILIFVGGIRIDFIQLPFDIYIEFAYFSIPITFLWIVGVTNSINLIDGLDGLASGVSSIALLAISSMAFLMNDYYVLSLGLILLASTLGFLVHNFYPAKIFLGDTGALFLGFMISVLSLLGFKNVTFISFIIPVIILGVPISDTLFAIIRRITNKTPLSSPDKYHLHHCLLDMGFSHRTTVILIYAMSAGFGITGVILTNANLREVYFFTVILVLMLGFFAEKIDWMGKEFKPFMKMFKILRLRWFH